MRYSGMDIKATSPYEGFLLLSDPFSIFHRGKKCVELLEKPVIFHRNVKWMVAKIHEVYSYTEAPQHMSCCLGETNVLACIYLRVFCGMSCSSTDDTI